MTQQIVNLGTSPNGASGDDARTAFQKVNDNFTELYGGEVIQPFNAKLSAIAASVWSANQILVATGESTLEMLAVSDAGLALIAGADEAEQRLLLGLGSAATRTVTTSTTDSTLARLLKVGDFGLGYTQGAAIPDNDLDSVIAMGVYNISSVTANVPVGAASGSTCLHLAYNGSVTAQQIVVAATSARMWFRHCYNSAWVDWAEITTESSYSDIGKDLRSAASAASARTTLGLGSAALLTAATSTTDNATGRALRVGDHGLGVSSGTMAAGASLDSLIAHCLFSAQDPTPPDWDSSLGTYPMGLNFYRSAIVRAQLAMSFGSQAQSGLYRRANTSDGWQSWSKLLERTDVVGTASQSSGVPTGAIIERGSNANGEYVRYADGTQICWGRSNTAVTTTVASANIFAAPALSSFTFPIAFASPPRATDAGSFINDSGTAAGSGRAWGGHVSTTTATQASLYYYGATASSAIYPGYVAVGRWY